MSSATAVRWPSATSRRSNEAGKTSGRRRGRGGPRRRLSREHESGGPSCAETRLGPQVARPTRSADAALGNEPTPRQREFFTAVGIDETKIQARSPGVQAHDDVAAAPVRNDEVDRLQGSGIEGEHLRVA